MTEAELQGFINAAEAAGGGSVYVGELVVTIYGTLLLPEKVRLIGAGAGRTILRKPKLKADGTTFTSGPILTTKNFSTDTGTTNIGPRGFSIEDMTFEAVDPTSNVFNRYGGVALYGYDFTIRNVHILGFDSNGLWTEWGGDNTAGIDNPLKWFKQPASITDLTLSKNWRCGWVHLGPHDTLATRVNSFGNGRENVPGMQVSNNGESNIWIARRMVPVVLVEKNGSNYRLSSPGRGYKPGVYAVVKAANNVGMLGWVDVNASGVMTGITWLNPGCVFDEAAQTQIVIGFLTNLPLDVAPIITLPVGSINLDPVTKKMVSLDMDSWGANLPAWPKITVKNNDVVPSDPAIVLPVLRGGRMHAGIIVNGGKGYDGKVIVETVQGANVSAVGIGLRAVSNEPSAQVITSVNYGSAGAWMDDVQLTATANGATITATGSGEADRFGEISDWVSAQPADTFPHGFRLAPVATQTTPAKQSPMAGGTILVQCHAWGSQTYGIRVSTPAILTACEAESSFGANLFLEAKSGTVTDAWIYDAGDKPKSPPGTNYGTGSATAVGIQLGDPGAIDLPSSFGYNSPSQWRISARIEQCHAGGFWNFTNGDAIQLDVHISSRCGLFHHGFVRSGNLYDDLRLSCFYGEGNFDRYAKSQRSSILPLSQNPLDFTQDGRILLWAGKNQMAEYFKSSALSQWSVKFSPVTPVPAASISTGVKIHTYGVGLVSTDALAVPSFLTITATSVLTELNFSSFIRFKGDVGDQTIALPSIAMLPKGTMISLANKGSVPVTLLSAGGDVFESISSPTQLVVSPNEVLQLFADPALAPVPPAPAAPATWRIF